ncbi:unnamed protein product [Rotaria sordida]|uniref:Uncharacterized protein n=1 Tax=Rotaria sordida TaxID=392033 RepID=A0A819FIS1_9BILA|nr:unnamed protein product [Rotaria sordida]
MITSCLSHKINLIPSINLLLKAKEHLKSEDLLISSIIKTNCSISNLLIIQWIINICICIPICSQQIYVKGILNNEDILISSQILTYGLYEFIIKITNKYLLHLKSSSLTYQKNFIICCCQFNYLL